MGEVSENSKRLRAMRIRATTTNPGAWRSSHYSDEWYTPAEIPAAIGGFDLDPSAGPSNHAKVNIRQPECGLTVPWGGRVWLNPPYSNVHDWMERLIAHNDGVALVNARPETQWFQRAACAARGVLWLKGRVNFLRPDGVATHPPVGSVLLAYGESATEALRNSGLKGVFMTVAGQS